MFIYKIEPMCHKSENSCVKSLIIFGELENSPKHTHCLARQVTNSPLLYNKLGVRYPNDYLENAFRYSFAGQGYNPDPIGASFYNWEPCDPVAAICGLRFFCFAMSNP